MLSQRHESYGFQNFNYQEKICLNFEFDDVDSWFEEYTTKYTSMDED